MDTVLYTVALARKCIEDATHICIISTKVPYTVQHTHTKKKLLHITGEMKKAFSNNTVCIPLYPLF